jgi:hypothetical protein
MKSFRVVVLDEDQKVIVSRIVTVDVVTREAIADRIRAIFQMHDAPYTVNVVATQKRCRSGAIREVWL